MERFSGDPLTFMGMFIGRSIDFWQSEVWDLGVMLTFDFGQGGQRKIKGMPI